MRGQRREGRNPSVEPELRFGRYEVVSFYPLILLKSHLDKALTFLDDKLLPSTSNAVERGYRRHRKMQKSIYRVRTMERLIARIALDMFRDLQSLGRSLTTKTLHQARAG